MCKKKLIEYEEIMKQWDYQKNKDNPRDISSGTHKKYWWICDKGSDHQWETEARERVKGSKCPYCMGKKVSVTNSLATLKPLLVEEWHPTKNDNKTPHDYQAFSSKKVWWQCKENPTHEWEATVQSRSNGIGCPCCSGRLVTQDENLEKMYPLISEYWHPTKNGNLKPSGVRPKSNRKVWWRCVDNPKHEWELVVEKYVTRRTLCVHCEEKKENPYIKLTNEEKERLKKEWHPTKNQTEEMTVTEKIKEKKYWWRCSENENHAWQGSVVQKLRKEKCPTCKREENYQKIEKQQPHLIKEWDLKVNKRKMNEVNLYTTEKYGWVCSKDASHTWDATISNRIYGTGCPYCSGNLATEEENFAVENPHLLNEWHPTKNIGLNPKEFTKNSSKKVWWICSADATHEWETTVHKRTIGRGCPYCTSQKASETNNLFYVDEELAKEWHPIKNKDLTAKDVTANSGKKIWWQCPKHSKHEWRATPASRRQGSGCPKCSANGTSKPEYEMLYFFEKNGIESIHRYKTEFGEVDIFLPHHNIAIEYNGEYFHKKRRKEDEEKFNKIKENYTLILVNEAELKGYEELNKEGNSLIQLYNKIPREQNFEYIKQIFEMMKIESSIEIDKKENHNILQLMDKNEIENSVAQNALLKKEWHYEKNEGVNPAYFSRGSNESVWWKCSVHEEHEWETKIATRSQGSGCPYCAGKKVDGTNSLKMISPIIAREWHPLKNENITTNQVTAGSSKKVWWKCKKNSEHEWAARVVARVKGTGCPHCYKEKKRNREKKQTN